MPRIIVRFCAAFVNCSSNSNSDSRLPSTPPAELGIKVPFVRDSHSLLLLLSLSLSLFLTLSETWQKLKIMFHLKRHQSKDVCSNWLSSCRPNLSRFDDASQRHRALWVNTGSLRKMQIEKALSKIAISDRSGVAQDKQCGGEELRKREDIEDGYMKEGKTISRRESREF